MALGQFELRPLDGVAGPVVAAEVRGDVDIATAAEFEAAVRALRASGPLVLDLSPAGYFDSAGFAVLDRLLGEGQVEVVMRPDSTVRKAATIVGVPYHDDMGSARAVLETRRG